MSEQTYHHAIHVVEALCKGCTHCMKRCPTTAIRIHGGKAVIDAELCIDCGQCMAVCPNHAIQIEEDPFSQLEAFTYRVGIIPAVFFAQFPDTLQLPQLLSALYAIGFTHLYLAETGVDILSLLETEKGEEAKPLISSFCPAVRRLIQIRFPLLVENVSTVRSPAQVTALLAKSELGGKDVSLGIFYLTPCAAKIAQFKTEGSEEHRLFDGVINFNTAYNHVNTYLTRHKEENKASPDSLTFPLCTSKALLWSLVKGQSMQRAGRTLAVDEMHNVIEFLELLEDENETNLQFLELDACAEGCVGGVLTIRNRFLASERLRHWADSLPSQLPEELKERILSQKKAFKDNLHVPPLEMQTVLSLDQDQGKALQKLRKMEAILSVLPGIDCGLCGCPTCRALAQDIAQSKASIRQCVVLKLKDPKELNSLSKIWGERPTAANGQRDDQA